ncbi:MAG: HD domain-containing protein [Lachnospiraceae bacterium]|nr:HD domain-containing protein [Lachnospiraceae bacterium]
MNTDIAQLIIQELKKYGQNSTLKEEKKIEKNPEWFVKYIPELSDCVGFCQNNPYHIYDVFSHTIHALESCIPNDNIVKLAVLFHDIGKPHCYSEDENGIGHFYRHAMVGANMTDEIMERLGFEKDIREKTVQLIHYHDAVFKPNGKNIRKWLQKIGEEQFERLLYVRRADIMGHNPACHEKDCAGLDKTEELFHKILMEKPEKTKIKLAISGKDLIAVGYASGKELGKTLKMLETQVVAGQIENSKDALLKMAAVYQSASHYTDKQPADKHCTN